MQKFPKSGRYRLQPPDGEAWRETNLSFGINTDHSWRIYGNHIREGCIHQSGPFYWVEEKEDDDLYLYTGQFYGLLGDVSQCSCRVKSTGEANDLLSMRLLSSASVLQDQIIELTDQL